MAEAVTIKVMCRFRPLNSKEIERGDKFLPKFVSDTSLKFDDKTYSFDRVFPESTTQANVYEHAALPIVKDVLAGFNGTMFAYGQTSSGKTHTMEGVLHDPKLQGIIPRIVDDIFNHIYGMDESIEFHIKVSYFEIYLDKIRDLLDTTKANLPVHEDKDRVPYVKGATERFVVSPDDVMDVVDEGKANRAVATTNMNAQSSRSHSIFLIQVAQENKLTETKLTGKLYLVDLAGSEKIGKTGAEGETLEEAKNINKSLSALGNVIAALADGTKTHIPYRDSKMTRILQEALGGNCRTTIIICASPALYNEAETKSTLMFGVRAKTIKNSVVANVELTADQWRRKYEKERDKAKKLLSENELMRLELERWRNGETVPLEERCEMQKELVFNDSAAHGRGDGVNTPSTCSTPLTSMHHGVNESGDLYKLLDEKDEEIHIVTRLNEQLKVQLLDLESLVSTMRGDGDKQSGEFQTLHSELQESKEEVSELMRALEDLALNYDQKADALQASYTEREKIEQELARKDELTVNLMNEIELLKEEKTEIQARTTETMSSLLRDLTDMGIAVNPEVSTPADISGQSKSKQDLDAEFTAARLLISKMKGEILTVIDKAKEAETNLTDQHKIIEQKEKELHEYRNKFTHHEQMARALQEEMRDAESKKRSLEEQLDHMNAELSSLKQQEQKAQALAESESETVAKYESQLESQLESNREFHSRQINRLRGEIDQKQKQIDNLREKNTEISSETDRLKCEYSALQTSVQEKEEKLSTLTKKVERSDQAKNDLRGLEETVGRELQTLHSLRRMFVNDLRARVRRAQGDSETDVVEGSSAQKHRIGFLESNLNQLTTVHKQLVRDNADLRCELPKLEKRLRCTADRVRNLESALREAREGAMKDKKKYQGEVERIKEAVRARNIARRAQQANIARPVRRPGDPASNPGLTLGGSGIRRPVVRPDSTSSREPAGGIRQWPASQQR